jgi:uncharacterized protein (TIGR00730 family)
VDPLLPAAVEVTDDRILLEGPYSRRKELFLVLRAVRDFIAGFRALHFSGPCVTIFGSARVPETHPYYALTREVGRRVSQLGFGVLTGGGPGLMEAANRGARDEGGFSAGCNIELSHEQEPNPYLDRSVTCHYFFVRKVLLFKYSYAFIAMPGGFGTLDELSEALTLVQTAKILNFPIILIGLDYWRPLLGQLHEMVRQGMLDEDDLRLLLATDDIEEVVAHLRIHAIDAFRLTERRVPKPSPLLGEQSYRPRRHREPRPTETRHAIT